MYIKKIIVYTVNLCGIPVSTLRLRLINPLITSSTNLSDENNFVHPIRSLLMPKSAIL